MLLDESNETSHTVRSGSEMCVFDFWAWRCTFPEPTVDTVPANAIWQKSKAGSSPCCISLDRTPRERRFLLSQGRWTERKVEERGKISGGWRVCS